GEREISRLGDRTGNWGLVLPSNSRGPCCVRAPSPSKAQEPQMNSYHGRNPASIQKTKAKASLPSVNGYGALRSVLEIASDETGLALSDLTVLSAQVDPYRLDIPAGHRDGEWVAKQLRRALKSGAAKIHWRGLHYVIVSQGDVRKPNGEPYQNNDENWTWLVNNAGKSARWLGYVPFERIVDNRNAEPIIHRKARVKPGAFVSL